MYRFLNSSPILFGLYIPNFESGVVIKVGLPLVVDHSGRVFSRRKPTIKDVATNWEAIML